MPIQPTDFVFYKIKICEYLKFAGTLKRGKIIGFIMMKRKIMSRENAFKLIELIHNKLYTKMDLSQFFDTSFLDEEDLEVDLAGISNGFLSELIHTITGYEVEICGEAEELYPCPCCGFKTLTERYDSAEGTGYDICPYCKWEDDGTIDVDTYSSINRGSILDYRKQIDNNPNIYYINKWMK